MQIQFRPIPGSTEIQRRFDAGSTSVQIGQFKFTSDLIQTQSRPNSDPTLARFSIGPESVRAHVRPKLGPIQVQLSANSDPSQAPVRLKPDSSQSQVRLTLGSLQSQYGLKLYSLQIQVGPNGDRGQSHCRFTLDSIRAQFRFRPAASQVQFRTTSAPAQIQFPTKPDQSQAPRRYMRGFRPNPDSIQLQPAPCSPPAPTQLRINADSEQSHFALNPGATRPRVSPSHGCDAIPHKYRRALGEPS